MTDVIVMGGGAAGWSAALAATQAGLSVLLLEKLAESGGSSALSGGCLAFAGTDLQAAQGVEDSPGLLLRDLCEVGQHVNDEALVRAYCEAQLATYDWLKAAGVGFSPVIETASGQSVPRVHTVDPADMVRTLRAAAEASGLVEYRPGVAARALIQDADGRVVGVRPGSGEDLFGARAVIIASGGFARNPDLLERYAPQYAEAVFVAGAGSQGDGLLMAEALGADLRDMAYVKGTFGKHPTDETNDHSLQAVYKGAIAVNQGGKRFVNESISYKLLGDAVMAQPWHTGYQIMDQGIFDTGDDRVRILDFGRRLEEGLFYVADSLEALAARIEIDPDVLVDTVTRYNGYVDAGRDPEFNRTHLVHHHGALRRIETAPFYAYPSTAVVFGTYCGLRIDNAARVLRSDGSAIAGLYAAGEVTGGFHGAAYMTGSALGKAVVFGRLAGMAAAAQ
ncbi:flavocytochrome c [Novosphingobium sp. Fuku2-ISO-50]|uniref:FAD-dependent oxidoreductase n=1 Tax=Novosphingobium sp. Fuku2-ISO-50 TaxID=1739114 RepID=UPI00076D954E|nr:flavocytochrome c [Novosphingobium sp. Fuku2-ISO-50]KUR76776.1 reductase [Novosphingobium sp. Fuku2-ISO-50]